MPDIRPDPVENTEHPSVSVPGFAPIVRRRRLPVVAILAVLFALVGLALFVVFTGGS